MTREEFIAANPLVDHATASGADLKRSGAHFITNYCPITPHKEAHRCVSIEPSLNLWRCNDCDKGGSVIDWIMLETGRSAREILGDDAQNGVNAPRNRPDVRGAEPHVPEIKTLPALKPDAGNACPEIVATYDYTNENGQLVFQVVRYEPKTFKQRRPDGNGGWIWGLNGIERVLYNLPKVLQAQIIYVCFSEDTEILTSAGWLPLPQLSYRDKVAQYSRVGGEVNFAEPKLIQEFDYEGEMVCFNSRFCKLKVTPDHRMLIRNRADQEYVVAASEVKKGMAIPTCGISASGLLRLSLDQVRLLIAFAADGSVDKRGFGIRWGFKKSRKIKRLRNLLIGMAIPFTEKTYRRRGSIGPEIGFKINRHDAPWLLQHMPDKSWNMEMLQWPLACRQCAIEELIHWDGHCNVVKNIKYRSIKFDTTRKSEADAVSAVAAITGYSCSVNTVGRESPRKTIFSISLLKKAWKRIGHNPRADKSAMITRQRHRGKVYCCTVDSGFLVVRREGRTTVAGNCEGEKDCATVETLGLVGTTNAGGSSGWLPAYSTFLKGKDVVVIPDSDAPGAKHGDAVVASLANKANSIKRIVLPDKDLTDYVARFSTVEEAKAALAHLVDETPHCLAPLPIYTIAEMEVHYRESVQKLSKTAFNLSKFLPSFTKIMPVPLFPGELVLVLADTGVGKSLVLSAMARAAHPLPTLFFELELPLDMMFARFAQMEMGCYHADVITDYQQQKQGDSYLEHMQGLSHISVCPESGLTTAQIETYIERSELKFGRRPALVFVDYIGLVRGAGARSRYEALSDSAEQMKVIAKKTETIIVMASQIARPPKDRKDLEIYLHDAKDSGALENSAGLVMGCWRPERDLIKIKVLKNTKGAAGQTIDAHFDGAKMRISAMPDVVENNS
jgi:DnaB-like helicase C terminal domain